MILKSEGDEATKATHRQQLLQMVSYAENQFECRRKLMLRYFQEDFDPAQVSNPNPSPNPSPIPIPSPSANPNQVPTASRLRYRWLPSGPQTLWR